MNGLYIFQMQKNQVIMIAMPQKQYLEINGKETTATTTTSEAEQ